MRAFPIIRPKAIAAVSVLLLTLSCATRNIVQAPTGRFQVQQGFNQYSPEQDVQLGQQAKQQVAQQMPLLPDSDAVARYVQQLGRALAAQAPGTKWPFEFHVINQKEINAFALPGGPVYVNLGTIQKAGNEGELAGVMAHEIAHVVLRHGTQQASKAQVAQIPLAILGAVLPGGAGGQLARMGLSFGAQSIFLKYSRDAEREADLLGAQMMYDANYNPYDMVEFFSTLEREGGPGVPQFLSDHPNPGNRAQSVSEAMQKFEKKSYRETSLAFQQVKQQADKMKPMTAEQIARWQQQQQQQRAQRGGGFDGQVAAPDGQFRVLDHQAFQVAYPAGWRVYGNQNSAVVVAPANAITENGIAVGVMIGGFAPRDGQSLPQATQELLQGMQRGNPDLRLASDGRQVSVNGMPALAVDLVGPSPIATNRGPLTEHDLLVTMQRPDGSVLYMVFISPEQSFQQLSPVFQQMLASFRMRG